MCGKGFLLGAKLSSCKRQLSERRACGQHGTLVPDSIAGCQAMHNDVWPPIIVHIESLYIVPIKHLQHNISMHHDHEPSRAPCELL